MKITLDIDCTPEEARRALGLPDLTPLHEAYLDQMKRVLAEGVTPDMVQAMMKSWMPMGEAGVGLWRQYLERIAAPART